MISNGRQRVVIANISPQVDAGRYPAKAAVHESTLVSADIFCDGHDELAAAVSIRHRDERLWKSFPMEPVGNDRWELRFRPSQEGMYQLRFQAWIDHFASWKKGVQKKADAGQELLVDLQVGAAMIEESLQRSGVKDKVTLQQWHDRLQTGEADVAELLTDTQLHAAMSRCTDPALVTVCPEILQVEADRTKVAFSSWYELFPRSASREPGRHGTFNDVKALLPRIAEMGFDVLYLPPIHPIGEQKRKGRNNALQAGPNDPGSPWAIGSQYGGHKSIHPELGTMKDFQSLIKAAQQFDIDIAMDIAFQCAPDHPYVKEHPEWFNWRPDGTVQYAENPPKKYEDIVPFNFETTDWKNLWLELKSIFEFWIGRGVSIFRIDNPHTKPFAFWEWMIGEVRKKNPQVIFLAEAFTRPRLMERLAKAGFNQSYTYFSWRNTKKELETYITELTQTEQREYFRPNFWPNTPDILPDELVHGGENMHIIRLVLAATLSSNYGMYGPVYELNISEPMPGKEEYNDNEKYEIRHWNWDQYTKTRELITRVNRIRKQHPALQTTWNITLAETSNEQLMCYIKSDAEQNDHLIIAVNLDPFNTQSGTVTLPLKACGLPENAPFKVYDLLSGDRYTWTGDTQYIELRPYEMPAHIFRVSFQEPLQTENIHA